MKVCSRFSLQVLAALRAFHCNRVYSAGGLFCRVFRSLKRLGAGENFGSLFSHTSYCCTIYKSAFVFLAKHFWCYYEGLFPLFIASPRCAAGFPLQSGLFCRVFRSFGGPKLRENFGSLRIGECINIICSRKFCPG